MSAESDIAFYRRLLVTHARTMPVAEAVVFLRGALAISGTHPEMLDVRRAHQSLAVADDQLETLSGQFKLNLDGNDGQ